MSPERWQQVSRIFEAALRCEPEGRPNFLDQVCAGDNELRREVESLLSSDGRAGSFMEASPSNLIELTEPVSTVAPATARAADPFLGRIVSNYRLEERLAAGGMGVLYRATDLKLGRSVAVKVLSRQLAPEETAKARFLREARAASALDHPNIGGIYHIEDEDGELFIVMALYRGETLKQRLQRGPLPVAEALEVLRQVALGLEAAHRAGIVHRDIKPANLLRTDEGIVKILDFGLAKLTSDSQASAVTQTGETLGTVLYMSPEQLRGADVDGRSDLWSFGVMAYELLAGISPFQADSGAATVGRILSEEPPSLGTVPGVPECLAKLVSQLLRKNPSERPQTATEVLRRLDAGLAAPVRRSSPQHWFSALKGRRLLLILVGVGVLVAASGLGWYFFVLLPPAPAAEAPQGESSRISLAAADFVNETKDEELNGLSGMLITSLEQSKRLSVLTRGRMFDVLKQLGRADAERIDELLGREICKQARVNALVLASIRRFGELYAIDLKVIDPVKNEHLFTTKEHGTGKESIPAMIDRISERTRAGLKEKAEEIRAASVAVAQSTTANLEAYQHYFQGQQLYARNDFEKAVPEFRKAVELDPRFALAHLALGHALGWMSNHSAEAEEYEIALRLGLPERERCRAEALLTSSRGEHERANQLSDECAARFPEEKGLLFDAGDWRFHSADLVGALPYFEKALSIDPNFGPAVEHLLWAWKGLGRADKALELAKAHAARVHEARVHVQLASAQLFAGDRALAIETLREAARLFPQSPGPALELANAYLFSGEPEKAESALRPVLEGRLAESDPQVALLARLELEMYRGRFRRAVAAVDNAAADAQKAGDANAISGGLAFWKAFALATGPRDLPAAGKIAATALDIPPDQLFVLYYLMEDVGRAGAVLETHPFYGFHFAQLLDALRAQKRGDRADAIARYEKIAQVPEMRGGALTQLAKLHLDGGEPQKALTELRKLQTTYVGTNLLFIWYPRSFYRLGKAYEHAGDRAAALVAYRRFLTLWKDADPDLVELQDAKSRVAALRGVARK